MPERADYPTEEPCTNCGQLIDTLDLPPLTAADCPHCGHRNLLNTQFHHFKLLENIGSGGMGAVFRAHDQSLDRIVALKLLRTEHMLDAALVAQFEKEAALTAAINHPNVVRVLSTGMDRGLVYIVMELVDRGSLDDLITVQRRVAEAQVLDVGIQIARGLQAAWRGGLLHRDVKPGNILFNEAHTAKIVDFGLAALADESGQIGGEVWGTPYYVAPEKLQSPPSEDFRSDIYSLGSALFHAIAGRAPYDANDQAILVLRSLKSQPVSLRDAAPEVSEATIAVIDRMLRIDPEGRYQSYEELIEHLQFARKEIAEGVPLPLATPAPPKSSRGLAIAVALLVAGIGLFFLLKQREKRPVTPVATPAPVTMPDAAERSAAARRLLIGGDAPGAVAAFRELDRDTVPQPLRNWNALQAVLAQFLAGQAQEAAATAAQIVEPPAVSSGAPGKFFIETATLAVAAEPPPLAVAEKLAPGNHEAFALLLGGVKHWMAGNFPEAVALFTRLQRATPTEPHSWIAEYHPLAAAFVADYATFTKAADAAKSAPDAQKKEALETVRAARTQLQHRPALAGQLGALETRLAAEVAALAAAMAEKQAADDAADATILRAMQPQVDDLCRQFRFADAQAQVLALQVRGEKHKPELELLRLRVQWMRDFKTAFFNDLRTANYQAEVRTVTNSKLGPGVWVPTEAKIKVMTKRGDFETLWSNVHPQAMIDAVTATLAVLPPEQAADRKWGLGLYLLALRLEAQARPLLTEASTTRPEYAAALPQLGLKLP
jgi:DNA-directed RNA polymerase subunit RPC12/RpoP